jgi:hypothetical protein
MSKQARQPAYASKGRKPVQLLEIKYQIWFENLTSKFELEFWTWSFAYAG